MSNAMRTVFLVIPCLFCAPAIAAEPTADDYLKFFTKGGEGEWVVKVKIGDKWGEGTFSAKVSLTKNCIVCFGSAILDYPAYQEIDGYDPGSKKWKWTAFNTAGEHWVTYLSGDAEALKGNQATFTFETTIAKPDGKKDVWRGSLKVKWEKDAFTNVFSEQTLNGGKQPDEDYIFMRKK
jgi:hypothetical protein